VILHPASILCVKYYIILKVLDVALSLMPFYYRMPRSKATEETDRLTRIAIVNADKCKPKRCRQECKKSCPVVRMGKLCIEVTPNDKIASISEELCIGCGICVKVKWC
jgi:MinD superfamily P-loop ATPase